jgi:hypothetical protein
MVTFSSLLIVGLPLAALVVAGWPLLLLPRMRTALAWSGGSFCLAGGTTLFGLLASAMFALPATAQETTPVPEVAAPADSTIGASSEDAPPIEVTPAPAASDDIKIETRPDGTVIIPAGRPQWVIDGKPKLVGDVYSIPVSSEPRALPRLAKQALDEALVKATNQFIADQLGSELAPALVCNYNAESVKREFVKPENFYDEVITVSIGDMHQSHALLEFPPAFRARIQTSWAEVRAASRLTQMGLFAGAALLLLGSVFGYFRLDNATRGYYTGRLQFMTAAAILAIVGAGIFVARWIHWM